MARVAQVGVMETSASYNRALIKTHEPVMLADENGKTIQRAMLNIGTDLSGAARCVSSECAMWRWNSREHQRVQYARCASCEVAIKEEDAGAKPPNSNGWSFEPYDGDEKIPARWIEPPQQAETRRTGYCGLAGKQDFS
jgi:hypothetical protein